MNTDDYYSTLEVSKTASQEEIEKAHRRLARKHHPDLNPNDQAGARQKFQKVQEAFDILGNPEKRKFYDQFGVSPDQAGTGGARGPYQWSYGAGGGRGPFQSSGPFQTPGPGNIDLEEILKMFRGGGAAGDAPDGDFFGMGGLGGKNRRPARGTDLERNLTIPFVVSVQGGSIDLTIRRDSGREEKIAVKIPAGISEGKKIRLAGLGNPGRDGGKPGSLLITVRIEEHPFFSRKGDNLYVKVPVTLKEVVFGGKIPVPTPKGEVMLVIPAGSGSGTKLRIRGCGIPKGEKEKISGDLIVELAVMLPKEWSAADLELFKKIHSDPPTPVRGELRWE